MSPPARLLSFGLTRARARLARLVLTAIVGIVGILGIAGVSACDAVGSSDTDKPEKTTLKVGVLPVVDVAPLYVAMDRGFFRDEGLTVRPEQLQSGALSIPRLMKGTLDMAFGNYVSYFLAQSKGTARLRVVAEGYQARPSVLTLLTAPDSGIVRAGDLAGKTVAVNIDNNVGTLTIHSVLKANGVDPAKVQTKIIPFPDIPDALSQHTVDAGFLVEPFSTKAQADFGARQVVDLASGPTDNLPIAGFVTSESFARRYPKTTAAFRRAIVKAQRLCADRTVVEKQLPRYTTIQPDFASIVVLGAFPTSLNPRRLQRVADLMREDGMTERTLDVRTLLS